MRARKKNKKKNRGATVRRHMPRTFRRRDGLLQFASDVSSQSGEDGILRKIFSGYWSRRAGRRAMVSTGAWDGQHLSNTRSFARWRLWNLGSAYRARREVRRRE